MKCIKNVFPACEGNEKWYSVKGSETKLEVWGQDSSHVHHFKSFRLHSRHIVLLEIVVLANSKKNKNIKANDVNLISLAGSTDSCFKTMYVRRFLCLRPIMSGFQCFVCGLSPTGKVFSHKLPLPSEITAFEPPPSPLEFPMIFHGGGGAAGMDIFFWNHTIEQLGSCTWKQDRLMAYCLCSLIFRQIYYWSILFPITIPSNWW